MLPDSVLPYARAGFALHWLNVRSKAPVDAGWSKAAVPSVDVLRASYRPGYNVGLRTGEPSRVAGGYVHVFDLDVRVDDLADEARAALQDILDGVALDSLPSVASGSGGASRHYYFITDKPFYSRKLAVSGEKVRQFVKSLGREVWRNTWEVELFGTGKQVAMPPSIHPDTGQPYTWERPFDLDLLDLGVVPTIPAARLAKITDPVLEDYDFEAVEPLTYKPGQLEAELDELTLDRIDEYGDWVTLGQALHHQFGGSREGFDLWVKHSKRSEKFDPREMPGKWRSFGRSRRRPVTMASVRQWILDARREAFVDAFDDLPDLPECVTDAIQQDATLADLLGDPLDADADDDPLDRPVELSWPSLLDINADTGAIRPHLHNVALMVKNDPRTAGVAEFNLFTQDIVQRKPIGVKPERRGGKAPKPVSQLRADLWTVDDQVNGTLWNDPRDNDIRRVFEAPSTQGGYGIKITDRDLTAALTLVARENQFHPIREYLEGLKWDGKPRCETMFVDYLGAPDNAYTRDIARLTLIAAVTRIYEPGAKFDFACIIEGLQGRGKSTFIQILGRSWFAELDGDFHDMKQMVEMMQGGWILEIPELSGFNRADVRAIKAFISRQEDRARLAYARRVSEFPRQCVFIGSTNDREYLKDDTGGRRFWPVYCATETIDFARFAANVDQVWAEALHLYREMRRAQPHGGLPLYLTNPQSRAIAMQMQETRRVESADDAYIGRIAAWLEAPINTGGFDDKEGKRREETCLVEIWCECLGGRQDNYGQADAQLLGRAMARVEGWAQSGDREYLGKYGRQRVYRRV